MTFSALGLADELVRAVADLGYTDPTPIQTQAIPAILAGQDVMAGAQTGTGKTAGFTLPILQKLLASPIKVKRGEHAPIRALVLTPTRELAAQVEESVQEYGKYAGQKSLAMFGGVSINPQIKALKGRVDILVSTPGRLLDHASQGTIDLSKIEILVLDEADRMLDMGFIHDIKKVLALLPAQRQNLLFSATYSDEIKQLADGLLNSPVLIEVARRNATVEAITQKIVLVDRENKRHLLAHLIKEHKWFQVLVFTRTKHGANRLAEQLSKEEIPALAIHGNKSQSARTRALTEFKSGTLQVLVATDIAARGIDIEELPHVINFELPMVAEDYVHRIGRTGRAGAEGEALSLVCVDEMRLLSDIEKLIKRALPREIIAGFEPDPNAKPEPIESGRRGRQQQQQGRGARNQQPRRDRPQRAPAEASEGASEGRAEAAAPREGGDNRRRQNPRNNRKPRQEGQNGGQNGQRAERTEGQRSEGARAEGQPRRQGQGQGRNGQPREGDRGNGQQQGRRNDRQQQGQGRSNGGGQRGESNRSTGGNAGNRSTSQAQKGDKSNRDAIMRGDAQPTSNENTPVSAWFDQPRRTHGRHR
ncbi:ATP-dependent RNA helicase RhlE [Silvimonas terrae]|uniref:ATP-dependent RNA helicase RhlE n=1 Tax=Silvimonas terrae TaxID=300266 RepID=A0A840RAY3_9NEIS|nr:DEAD/DEAH box helicase [Silvimonas terrae]MBB5189500.1 ATP-dependent RNA helicase RhlE [Silvimonas terrae]